MVRTGPIGSDVMPADGSRPDFLFTSEAMFLRDSVPKVLRLLLLAGLACCMAPGCSTDDSGSAEVSTQPIREDDYSVDGATFLSRSDFEAVPATGADTWTVIDGELRTTGTVKGYVRTRKVFGPNDFRFHCEFRYESKPEQDRLPNTGVLLFVPEGDAIWPFSLEVQGRHDELAQIKVNGGELDLDVEVLEETRLAARKPIGAWNELLIESKAGALKVMLNGEHVASSQPTELKSGRIGLQSEGFPVQFRNVWVSEESIAE